MAIQITGLFKNPTSQLIHESPLLKIVAHLSYQGNLHVDLHVVSEDGIHRDTVVFSNVDRSKLNYDISISDSYNSIIQAIETFVIPELQSANSINSKATFSRT